MEHVRCPWAKHELEIAYHDMEWGKPLYDDQRIFEMLVLEGMQAGLSWLTILKKREAMRAAFDGFDPVQVAAYGDEALARLMQNDRIIRNRSKLSCTVGNAKAFLEVQREFGSFARYIWSFTGGAQIVGAWQSQEQAPATSELSDLVSGDLRRRGFRFVGSTICYSLLQAIGIINDHMVWCEQYGNCAAR